MTRVLAVLLQVPYLFAPLQNKEKNGLENSRNRKGGKLHTSLFTVRSKNK